MDEKIGIDQRHPAKYWHRLDDGRIQCDLARVTASFRRGSVGCVLSGAGLMINWC